MSDFIHTSPTTKVVLSDGKIHKKFIDENKDVRFEKELAFLKTHKSKHLPKLIDFDSKKLELILGVLKSEYPGFLDNTEASLLKLEDFHRIREALFEIQKLNDKKTIVHGDLAPHNIYLTDKKVVIADWDQYFFTDKTKYCMYDYATLWSFLDTNEEDLINIFKEEYNDLKQNNLLEDFKFCYLKKVDFLKKYPKQWSRGVKLREAICDMIQ